MNNYLFLRFYRSKNLSFHCMFFILCTFSFAACNQSRYGDISGNVQREGATNHEGIQIYLPGTQYRAITDQTGDFLIQELSPGEYSLVASTEGFIEYRTQLKLNPGMQMSIGATVLSKKIDPIGKISGFVTLSGRTTHEGIIIILVGSSLSTLTSTTGYYELENVPTGTYKLVALQAGWLPATLDSVEVLASQETEIPEIQLHAAAPLPTPTRVIPTLGTNIIHGAAFLEREIEHNGIRVALADLPDKYTITDVTGTFELTGLDALPHTLTLSCSGYLEEIIPDAMPVSPTSTETVGFITLRKELKAEGVGILQGHIYLNGRSTHANTIVRLQGVSQSVVTDAEGRFLFVGIPAGLYTLVAEHPGYNPGQLLGVRVISDQISQTPDLTLPSDENQDEQGIGSLQGIVLLEGEMDHGGITVAVDGMTLNTVTGPTGEYLFENVPMGAYTIIFSKGGYKNAYLEGISILSGQPTVLEPIVLQKDIEPPFVIDSFPRHGARRIPIDHFVDVLVRFSERMEGNAVKNSVLIDPPVDFEPFFDRESELSNFDILHLRLYHEGNNPVQFRTQYTIVITPVAITPIGIPLVEPFLFSFTTSGPLILRTVPDREDERVLLNIENPLMFETNAPVDSRSFERALRVRPKPDSNPMFQYNPFGMGTLVLVNISLRPNTHYRIMVNNTLRSIDGQRFDNTPFTLNCTTAASMSMDSLSPNIPPSRIRRR